MSEPTFNKELTVLRGGWFQNPDQVQEWKEIACEAIKEAQMWKERCLENEQIKEWKDRY